MATITVRNGRHLVRIRIGGSPAVSRTFNDRRSAKLWALQTEDDIRRGVYTFEQQDYPTLFKALVKYEKEVTPTKRGIKEERSVLRILKRLEIASKPLDQITPRDFVQVRDTWAKELSASTIQKRHALLSHLYNVAIREWGFNIENPLLRVSKLKVDNARNRVICSHELDTVLKSAAPSDTTLNVVARLAWYTAARLGELTSLQWEHVDLLARTIYFPITKNGQGRSVPLVPAAVVLLNAIKPQPQSQPTGPVVTSSSEQIGKRWSGAVKRGRAAYEADCKVSGVAACPDWLVGARFHDLRHSAITRLAELGLSTLELAAISGHRSLQMLNRYTHIKAENLAVKLAALEQRADVRPS